MLNNIHLGGVGVWTVASRGGGVRLRHVGYLDLLNQVRRKNLIRNFIQI